jgi:tetratricopeptide (TPR) repeat protein
MRKILTFVFAVCISLATYSQVTIPPDIKVLLDKAKSGKEMTEEEESKMEKWMNSLDDQLNKSNGKSAEIQNKSGQIQSGSKALCPAKTVIQPASDLTRDKYVLLAQSLMSVYGPKSGDLPKLKSLLETSKKPTDGADMGAMFMVEGAGSASIYATAWSAAKKPDDILTANNLGVALKDVGEYAKSIQVLKYADKLKPNIGLIQCNLGWAYREAGDYASAKTFFNKALTCSPEMTSPYLGLGLITKCEGNNIKAEEYLRKALAQRYSAVGIGAMKQAKAANQSSGQNKSQQKPLSEKGDAGKVNIPELPVFEQKSKMAQQKETLDNYISGLDSRMGQLLSDLKSTIEVIKKQQSRALQDPDNSIVFRRDFATEIMQFTDVTDLLFGQNSNYSQALKTGTSFLETNGKNIEKDIPAMMQFQEKGHRLQEQLNKLLEQLIACGDNDLCKKKVEAEIDKVEYEGKQVAFQMCKLSKGQMDMTCANSFKNYQLLSNALKEAIPDYYAFTNPILERIYSPSYNEFYNLYREALVLNHLKISAGFAATLPELAEQYNKLKCVEPEPPQPPVEAKDPVLDKQKEKDCPLGKDGIKGGIGALSFELSCVHVKLSGGEGVLWSVKRDFTKHETTIWGGVGVKGEYGRGNVTAEATLGAEVTIGQGDVIKNFAVTSSVKAGIGGLVEGEINGRFAAEGGPSIETNAGLITPELPKLGGKE